MTTPTNAPAHKTTTPSPSLGSVVDAAAQSVVAQELTMFQKNWYWVALGTFVVGLLIGVTVF